MENTEAQRAGVQSAQVGLGTLVRILPSGAEMIVYPTNGEIGSIGSAMLRRGGFEVVEVAHYAPPGVAMIPIADGMRCEYKECHGRPTQAIVAERGVKLRCEDHEVSSRIKGTFNADITGVAGLGRCLDVVSLAPAATARADG